MGESRDTNVPVLFGDSSLDTSAGSSASSASSAENSALDIAVQEIAPYLLDETKLPELRQKLSNLGVKYIDDLKHLKWETDLEGLVGTIQCRKLELKFINGDGESNKEDGKKNQFRPSHFCRDDLFNNTLLQLLNGKTRLPRKKRLAIVRVVADEMEAKMPPSLGECKRTAKALTNKWPVAFNDSLGYAHLADQLFNHVEYTRREERAQKLEGCQVLGPNRSKKLPKGTQKDKYGINEVMFLPNELPTGETPDSQDVRREWLARESKRVPCDLKKVRQYMETTFPSQRGDVVMFSSVETILRQWPFLGKFEFVKMHFYKLMGLNESECMSRLTKLLPTFVRFLRFEADKSTKDNLKDTIAKRQALVKVLIENKEKEETDLKSAALCLCTLLESKPEQAEDALFHCFEESTSYDEICSSTHLKATPFIAVKGLQQLATSQCYVFADKCSLFEEELSFHDALLCLFMIHFNFSIHYAKDVAGLMEFFQRYVFTIEGKGSKTARAKGQRQPPQIQKRLLSLMSRYDDYKAKWSL